MGVSATDPINSPAPAWIPHIRRSMRHATLDVQLDFQHRRVLLVEAILPLQLTNRNLERKERSHNELEPKFERERSVSRIIKQILCPTGPLKSTNAKYVE